MNSGIEAGHYYKNIYGTSCKSWIITPTIDLSTATSAQLSFDAVFTGYSSASAASGFESNSSQAFMVIVSADGGNTWLETNATKWQNEGGNYTLASLAGTSYMNQVINLNAYLGDTIRIAFYAQSTTSGGDNNLHIDNIAVTEVPGCPNVMGLTLDSSDASSAYVSWNDNGATSYEVDVLQNGTSLTTVTVVVTDTTAAISGLALDNDYQVVVRAICGSDNGQWTSPLNVHIGYCLPTPTSVDNSGVTSVSFGGMTNTTSHAGSTAAYVNNSTMAGSVPAGTTASVDITYATGYTYGTIIWVDWNDNMSFEGTEVVYAGESTNSNPTTLTATFDIPATQAVGNYRMRILGADMDFDDYTISIADAASANPCASFAYGIAEDYTLTVTGMPSCMAVTNLAVDSVSATSISISWSDNDNTGATYSIYGSTGTVVASGITTTSYTITGLTASTSYTFGVVANCSATESSDVATITAMTDCAGGSCVITIAAQDGWGDGWENSHITISQNGATVATYNMADQNMSSTTIYDTFLVSVCSGTPVTFSWTSGSDYDDEAGFQIIDGGGAVVYTVSDASTLTDNAVFYTLADACPSCNTPVVTVDNATENTVTISWTGSAASYDVYNGTTFVANVTTNTYTFTNLTAGTAYTFGVQAICSAADSSWMATITVMTTCADVTALPYFEGFENDLGCWNTVNGSTDGMPWFTYDCAALSTVNPHGGNYVASSWSWNSSAMHADAWLISPRFVLPNVNTGDSITFSWWEIANANYADSYSVAISTTTDDTASFTVVRPSTAAAGTWTQQSIDLTSYAGQSVYVAFHHVDYDENYLLIDDVEMYVGSYVPPAPDTLTVNFITDNATMGTTIPAPGTYQYLTGDTVHFGTQRNPGYRFQQWVITYGTGSDAESDTIGSQYANGYYILANALMSYRTVTFKAFFEAGNPDSIEVTYAVNDATMGTTNPAPGVHSVYVGDELLIEAIPNTGYMLSAFAYTFYMNGNTVGSDTIFSGDDDFTNPKSFGAVSQSYVNNGITFTFTAIFEVDTTTPPVNYYNVTVNYDATMGTVTGIPTEAVEEGTSVTLTATANEGYEFVGWMVDNNTITDNPYTFTVTGDVTIMAHFREVVGINGVDEANIKVYSTENRVIVSGAEGNDVYVYDINGRTMGMSLNAGEQVEFRMPATGVYIVKIGNTVTKRVVVIR